MSFIDDNQIEVANSKATVFAIHLLDQVHHGLVSRNKYAAPGFRLFGTKVYWARVWQMRFEGVAGLDHKGDSVGEKQGPFDPIAPLQKIDQADRGACFTRSGRHY